MKLREIQLLAERLEKRIATIPIRQQATKHSQLAGVPVQNPEAGKVQHVQNPFIPEEIRWLSQWFQKNLKDNELPISRAALLTTWLSREVLKEKLDKKKFVDHTAVYRPGEAPQIMKIFAKEDLKPITDELMMFVKYNKNVEPRDLMQIGYYNLHKVLAPIQKKIEAKEMESVGGEAKRFEVSKRWLVIQPETHRAVCKYGAGTRWCVTQETDQYWNQYTRGGKNNFYILIDRANNNEKYAFIWEEGEFRDAADEMINPSDILEDSPELFEFFKEHLKSFDWGHKGIDVINKKGKFSVQFDEWEDLAELIKDDGDTREDYYKQILSGMGHELFYRGDMQRIKNFDDVSEYVDQKNMRHIERILGTEEPAEFDESERWDEVKEKLESALTSAQETADESEAYTDVVDTIMSELGARKQKVKSIKNKKGTKMAFEISKVAFLQLLKTSGDSYGFIQIRHPRDGYYGDIKKHSLEWFNEKLSDELDEIEPLTDPAEQELPFATA